MNQVGLSGRSALVTGAASGIGRAVATALASKGAAVCIADVDEAGGNRVRGEITAAGGCAVFERVDVSNVDSVRGMIQRVIGEFGRLDILVNNAGLQHVAPVIEFPEDQWDRLIGVMLTGTFLCTKYALPYMVRNHWGRVVNIASVHGLIASPFKAAYVSAKHGIVGFTKVVAWEVADYGVTANAICPSWVRTPLVEGQMSCLARTHGVSVSEVEQRLVLQSVAIKRVLEPDEVAALVIFLCTEAAGGITGAALPIDGGQTAH